MTTKRISALFFVGGVIGVIAVGTSGFGLFGPSVAVIVDDAAQLISGLTAVICCGWTARHKSRADRCWRLLMCAGMVGWTAGQAIWSWHQICGGRSLPLVSWADVGYLSLPVFALAALLVFAAAGTPRWGRTVSVVSESLRRRRLVLVIDGMVVVGSLFILTWSTALGAVVHASAPTTLAFAVAVAYPVTDLVLVVIVVLLAAQPVRRRYRTQLLLLGLGLVALSVSDSVFAYLVSSGAEHMPPVANMGFVAGPLLIAAAPFALVTSGPALAGSRTDRTVHWTHLVMPYLPLPATGALIVAQTVRSTGLDPLEVYLGLLIVALVVARQMITLFENARLLERVRQGQERLEYQAFHDPLTGLANRALFRDRLTHALERHHRDHRPVALLFLDLDDFKIVNDNLGHAAGDVLLSAVGERLRAHARSADTVARLGGDEFAILLDGYLEHPDLVGERILAALRQPLDIGGHTVSVGASLGVVVADADERGLCADALLRRADAAMYAGKRRGKGRLVWYRPEVATSVDNLALPVLPAMLAGTRADPVDSDQFVGDQFVGDQFVGDQLAVDQLAVDQLSGQLSDPVKAESSRRSWRWTPNRAG